VLLADDQSLIRAGFRSILERDGEFEVVAEAADGVEVVAQTQRTRPDVVLMDIRMPRQDGHRDRAGLRGPGAGRDTRHRDHHVRTRRVRVRRAARGAAGFLLKDLEPDDLRPAVRTVAAGEALLAPRVTRRLIDTFMSRPVRSPDVDAKLASLTDREREIVTLAGGGLTNDEIAVRLTISPLTAKTDVSRAMLKVNARDRAELVVFAYDAGLVLPAV
jgi:DNA-binding NarL/FixJ family response regulator